MIPLRKNSMMAQLLVSSMKRLVKILQKYKFLWCCHNSCWWVQKTRIINCFVRRIQTYKGLNKATPFGNNKNSILIIIISKTIKFMWIRVSFGKLETANSKSIYPIINTPFWDCRPIEDIAFSLFVPLEVWSWRKLYWSELFEFFSQILDWVNAILAQELTVNKSSKWIPYKIGARGRSARDPGSRDPR